MTIDIRGLPKKCQTRISGELNVPLPRAGGPVKSTGHAGGGTQHQHPVTSQAHITPERSSADEEDMTYRFAGSVVVEALKAQLDKLPDIRQSRVDSLKQALAAGRYQAPPHQIAAAMLADGERRLG